MPRTLVLALISWIGLAALPGGFVPAAQAHDPKPAAATAPATREVNLKARAYFGDEELISQDGRRLRFYTDLLQGKVVLISTFYGDCTESCPVIMATLAKVQKALGDRLGKVVSILSLTVDPVTDTPPRLKALAGKLHARPGWFFLTGKKANVDSVLSRLGQSVDAREDHLNIVLIGNDRTGRWKKAFALASPEALLSLVEAVAGDE